MMQSNGFDPSIEDADNLKPSAQPSAIEDESIQRNESLKDTIKTIQKDDLQSHPQSVADLQSRNEKRRQHASPPANWPWVDKERAMQATADHLPEQRIIKAKDGKNKQQATMNLPEN